MRDLAPMLSMYSGQVCIGFLLKRGRQGVEAYDANCASLGIFPDQNQAANAVSNAASPEAS